MNGTTFAVLRAATVEDVQEAVRSGACLLARGGGTKPALSTAAEAVALDLSALRGITEYQPSEFTFTARAGTPLAEIAAALAEYGQALPFDPPLLDAGATLGGAIASGLSGSGRYRYGGIRDFLLGVRFVDGRGRMVRGGGKVVKNAAGFDLPKLFIGSVGRLGVLVDATFKVFPKAPATATVRVECDDLASLHAALLRLGSAPLDLDAVDMTAEPPALWVRLGGPQAILAQRTRRLVQHLGSGTEVGAEQAEAFWIEQREFAWANDVPALAKVGLTPGALVELDPLLAANGARRRYSVGGHLAWVAWPGAPAALDGILQRRGLAGILVRGAASHPLLGRQQGSAVLQRIKQVLDPQNRFPTF